MLDKRGARHGRRRAARFKSSSAQASAGGGGALTWWTSLPSVVLRRSLKRRATVRVRFYVAFAASTTRCGGLVLVLVVAFTVLGVDPYLGVGSISDSLSLDDNYPGREKRITADSRPRRRGGLRGPPPRPPGSSGARILSTRDTRRRLARLPALRRSCQYIYHFSNLNM